MKNDRGNVAPETAHPEIAGEENHSHSTMSNKRVRKMDVQNVNIRAITNCFGYWYFDNWCDNIFFNRFFFCKQRKVEEENTREKICINFTLGEPLPNMARCRNWCHFIISLYATEPRILGGNDSSYQYEPIYVLYYLYMPYVFDKYQSSELKIVNIKML